MENTTKPTTARDVFLQLLTVITLYVVASSFIALVFQIINTYIPDPLAESNLYDYFRPAYKTAIRWSVSTLVIVFPVYAWVTYFMHKEFARVPEKSKLKTRTWLLALTLFAAVLIIVGDLVRLLYNFMQGELTLRFALKALTVLVVAAAVLCYYRWDMKRTDFSATPLLARIFSGVVIVVVVAGVVGGFFVAGLPQSQRLKRFDEHRVQHLKNIQVAIIEFWQKKNRLPANLDELKDDISGYKPPVDPQTEAPYEYAVKDTLKFELCATFNFSTLESSGKKQVAIDEFAYRDYRNNWDHDAKRFCFPRTIDPAFYKSPAGNRIYGN